MSTRRSALYEVPEQRMASGFADVLQAFKFESLEQTTDSVFALTPDLRLSYVNPAYLHFGSENGGQPVDVFTGIGAHVGESIAGPLRDFYLVAYQRIMDKGERWDHEYECSSPTLFRRYVQSVYPLQGGAGLVVVNHLVVEQAHGMPVADPDRERYLNRHGLIVQCSHCRCVQRQDVESQWDWVPAWVAHCPQQTTHSLCRPCFAYYCDFLLPTIDKAKQDK